MTQKITEIEIVADVFSLRTFLSRKVIDISDITMVVLDEADELLSDGFRTNIYNIFQYLPPDIQVALFTATLPDEILTLSTKFMRNP